MEMSEVKFEAPKEVVSLGKELTAFIADCKKALSDGLQVSDAPVILASSLANLLPAIKDAAALGPELAAAPAASEKALACAAVDILAVLKGQADAPAPAAPAAI